jgi:predicted HNH restriction endonuclease
MPLQPPATLLADRATGESKRVVERNPNWTRDELILALDLYMRHRPAVLGNTSADVIELSEILNPLAHADRNRSATHRNANGVAMKLLNFRPFDPDYTASGRVGLHHTSRGDEQVWREFATDPMRLRQTAAAIRAALTAEALRLPDDDDVDDGMVDAPEGRLLTRLHRVRERDRRLVEAKKKQALRQQGRVGCEACKLTPELNFGERGRRVIECHHTRPLHTLVDGDRTRLDDLALVCANCHRLIHGGRPWLTLDDLRLSLVGYAHRDDASYERGLSAASTTA